MSPPLETLSRRLLDPREADAALAACARQAAVACVLHARADGLGVLLMRRAERADDRWSGQISLPGGHSDPGDADLVATARRETLEEVGVDLAGAGLLGRLPARRARARERVLETAITPFVFAVEERPEIRLGPEATRAFWLPLADAAAGALDTTIRYGSAEHARELPAWRWDGEVVWGMTFRMLSELLELL